MSKNTELFKVVFTDDDRAKEYLEDMIKRTEELASEILSLQGHLPSADYGLKGMAHWAEKDILNARDILKDYLGPYLISRAGTEKSKRQVIESQEPTPSGSPKFWVIKRISTGLFLKYNTSAVKNPEDADTFRTHAEAEKERLRCNKKADLIVVPVYELPEPKFYVMRNKLTGMYYSGPGVDVADANCARRVPKGTDGDEILKTYTGYKCVGIY